MRTKTNRNRSRKWFNKNHPLVEFKRDDPHKEERERLQALKKAAVERGEEIPVKARKQSVKAGSEGCSARVGCALNDLYNLERITRTGRCNYVVPGLWAQGEYSESGGVVHEVRGWNAQGVLLFLSPGEVWGVPGQ